MANRKTNTAASAGERARASEPPIRERVEAVRQRVAASIGPKEPDLIGSPIEHLPRPRDLAALVELREVSLFELFSVFDILQMLNKTGTAISCQPRCNKRFGEFNDVGLLVDWYNELVGFVLDRCVEEARTRVPVDQEEALNRFRILVERDLINGEYASFAEAVHGIRMVAA